MVDSTVGGATDPAVSGRQVDTTAAEEWRPLDRRAVMIWRVRATVIAVVVATIGGLAVIAWRITDPQPPTGDGSLDLSLIASNVTAVVGAVTAACVTAAAGSIVVASRRYRRWRWRVGPDAVVVERGLWRHRRVQVPIDDIHTLSEHTGPLLRRFDVLKVQAFASGPVGSVSLPVLGEADVAALRHGLGFDDDDR